MDSNVSKNTNSHKFFKIALNQEKLTISLKNSIKQWLLSTWDLYQQKFEFTVKDDFIAAAIVSKISLVKSQLLSVNSLENINQLQGQSKFIPIVYGCPFGRILASESQLSLQIIVTNLGTLLQSKQNIFITESELKLSVVLLDSGWLNFYLDSKTLVVWLNKLLNQIQVKQRSLDVINVHNNISTARLLSVQYIHARCCSLLRLGAREKLITLQDNLAQSEVLWQSPVAISWLDQEQNLWLSELSEYDLLRQLLFVTDIFTNTVEQDWTEIAMCLSKATAIFFAECRFLGEIKQKYPAKAIARLGLIAIVQYWLELILTEKLNLPAPTHL
ncbi:MAG: DALR anticodon-binding domain-containing protein [Cyanobacteria bacterium P01_G01_bin.39]